MNGIPSKLGNWFEEDYVVFQALRVLHGLNESVMWEGEGADGRGIDCWIREDGRRIAIQTKIRTAATWPPAELVKRRSAKDSRSILGYAREQLERADNPADEYWFVSDAKAPSWSELVQWAMNRSAPSPEAWSDDARKVAVEGLGLNPDTPAGVSQIRGLLVRMRIEFLGESIIERLAVDFSAFLNADPPRLVSELRATLKRRLCVELSRRDLEEALRQRGVVLGTSPDARDIAATAERMTREYIERVVASRQLPRFLERSEVSQVLEAFSEPERTGRTILVHGASGYGKSEILAQVALACLEQRTPILGLSVVGVPDEALGLDPIRALHVYAGSTRPVLLIDQIDELANDGLEAQRRLIEVERWILAARQRGFTIILGCRTLEARHESRLGRLLNAPNGHGAVGAIPVDLLPETTVTEVLAQSGLAVNDLHLDLRQLARVPLFLSLIVQLIEKSGFQGLRTEQDLCQRWWDMADRQLGPRGKIVLGALVGELDQKGESSVDEQTLPETAMVDALVDARILRRIGRGRIAPVHNRLTDARIAERWAREMGKAEDMFARLGPRQSQDLHLARRLRLAVPLIAADKNGPCLVDQVLRSPDVRTLLKRSVLMAVAGIDVPTPDLIRTVLGWLKDGALRDPVAWIVLRGQTQWFDADGVRGWLNETWARDTDAHDLLIAVVSSVSQRRGAEVARHLTEWSRDDVGVLERAKLAFWNDPSLDAEELFEARLRLESARPGAGYPDPWTTLLDRNPRRAVRLLACRLQTSSIEDLIRHRNESWRFDLPVADALPMKVIDADTGTWPELKDWWRELELPDLDRIPDPADGGDEVLPRIVDLIALALGRLTMDHGVRWIFDELPQPLRPADKWLLLRLGAKLPKDAPSDVADALAAWFISDVEAAHITLEFGRYRHGYELAGDFLAGIGPRLTDETFAAVENYLIDYPDWSVPQQRQRMEWVKQGWPLFANEKGVTAWRLLPRLHDERLSIVARGRLGVLRAKFAEREHSWEMPSVRPLRSIRSPIDDAIAERWEASKWLELLRSASDHEHWGGPDEQPYELSKGSLAVQLGALARSDPSRYVEIARELAQATPPAPPIALNALLDSIARAPEPKDQAPERDDGVDDKTLESLLLEPAILNEPICARSVALAAKPRPDHAWSDAILNRLEQIGSNASGTGLEGDGERDVASYRLNNEACIAVEALARIACGQPRARQQVLGLAEGLGKSENPAVLASAAFAARCCFDYDRERAVGALLQASRSPRAAAETDVRRSLLFAATSIDVREPSRVQARDVLISLAKSDVPWIAERGGNALMHLRSHETVSDGDVDVALRSSVYARRGAAKTLGASLHGPVAADWMFARSLALADNDDQETAVAVLRCLAGANSHRVFEHTEFVNALAHSKAATFNPEMVLRACDNRATLLPVAEQVLTTASNLADHPRPDIDPWLRKRHADLACGQLSRLVEEAEVKRDSLTRTRALDAWDRLLEVGDFSALEALQGRVA